MTLAPTSIELDHKNSRRLASGQRIRSSIPDDLYWRLGPGPQDTPRDPHGFDDTHTRQTCISDTSTVADLRSIPEAGQRRWSTERQTTISMR